MQVQRRAVGTIKALLAHSVEHLVGIEEAAGSKPAQSTNKREWWNGRHSTLRPCRLAAMRVQVLLRAPRPDSQKEKATASKAGNLRVRVPLRIRALSSEAEHLLYTQGVGISKFSARTITARRDDAAAV